MEITAKLVKELRDKTGVGLMECKKALKDADGNLEEAVKILRTSGLAKAEKKSERESNEGIIHAYIHPGAKLGVLVKIACESDFVAKTDDFTELANKIAMHIAATDPLAIAEEDLDPKLVEAEKEIYRERALKAGKPENIVDKIVEGQIKKYYTENCLLSQPFIMNEDITVKELISDAVLKLGENINIKKYARYHIG
ncbi:MAG: translation elongation factor Ts [Candidatus Cloacimonetes bacterium]|nr:translation elongation factor Ts [Candidatus Cloacimonadota bacterium]